MGDGNAVMMDRLDPVTARIGRNFFREPADPNLLQSLGLPVLTKAWNLRDRPLDMNAAGFSSVLLQKNVDKERSIPYSKAGGLYLALPATSVLPELNAKSVHHLNYRWPALERTYPMTRLIDEIVQIADGVYLGQLVMATHHYSLGPLRILGRPYAPVLPFAPRGDPDYGYQNDGYFPMIDPACAGQAWADDAFPFLRPRPGEIGYEGA
jgi:hypothetical protein